MCKWLIQVFRSISAVWRFYDGQQVAAAAVIQRNNFENEMGISVCVPETSIIDLPSRIKQITPYTLPTLPPPQHPPTGGRAGDLLLPHETLASIKRKPQRRGDDRVEETIEEIEKTLGKMCFTPAAFPNNQPVRDTSQAKRRSAFSWVFGGKVLIGTLVFGLKVQIALA
ncbi:hypothetical protein F5876DRAFT_68949 [Lentinula aff. lateritia]|uniref:Uncharacterized protein n=1 Tax=Lentinula aff. lateritia TaxID=2804960 RepID=A0ACC1TNV1_9AGAR|nr:hypothetical protein F5876DRAFT_68949 [Lentinula aff. lateritia]